MFLHFDKESFHMDSEAKIFNKQTQTLQHLTRALDCQQCHGLSRPLWRMQLLHWTFKFIPDPTPTTADMLLLLRNCLPPLGIGEGVWIYIKRETEKKRRISHSWRQLFTVHFFFQRLTVNLLSKRQSLPTTVLPRTPLTQTISFRQGLTLSLDSNHFRGMPWTVNWSYPSPTWNAF